MIIPTKSMYAVIQTSMKNNGMLIGIKLVKTVLHFTASCLVIHSTSYSELIHHDVKIVNR